MVIFRDCHVPTLVRSVLPDNPKGVTKDAEEILEWINGLNSLSRNEGIDEQFYMSGWGVKSYSGIRSGKVRFIIPRVFINIIGGIQPDVTWKLFKNDRDTTGFIFRLLFAPIDEQRIALAENDFMIPNEIKSQHRRVIRELFNGLPVEDGYQQPKVLIMSAEAKKLHQNWHRNHAHNINGISDERTRNIKAGILGKMAEYAIRFCGLLCVSDMSYENQPFLDSFEMDVKYMERAIKLADYFYESAWTVYSRVVKQVTAPVEVLRYAGYVRAGWSNARIGDTEFPGVKSPEARRKRAARILIKMVADYPKVFGANAKT